MQDTIVLPITRRSTSQHRLDKHRDTCLEVLVNTRCKLAHSLDLVPQSGVLQLFLLLFGKGIPSDFQKPLDASTISRHQLRMVRGRHWF